MNLGRSLFLIQVRDLESVRPPIGMDARRFERRNQLYNDLISSSPVGEFGSDYQKESLKRSMEQAYRLLNSPEAKAFDLSTEPKPISTSVTTPAALV
jgi:hypothetical protein